MNSKYLTNQLVFLGPAYSGSKSNTVLHQEALFKMHFSAEAERDFLSMGITSIGAYLFGFYDVIYTKSCSRYYPVVFASGL